MQTHTQVRNARIDAYVSTLEANARTKQLDMGERIRRAGVLVKEGKVRRVGEELYEVESGTRPKPGKKPTVYIVNGRCSCPDGMPDTQGKTKAPLSWCKHRLSAKISHLVEKDLQELRANRIPHAHRYVCQEHTVPEVDCWEQACPDAVELPCPICTPQRAAASLASESDGWGVFVGETQDHDNPNVPAYVEAIIAEEGVSVEAYVVEPEADAETAALVEQAHDIANGEKPLDYSSGQYEEAPVKDERVPFLPEAAVSCCFTFKTPGGGQITYTMRGHSDADVLARIPAVLAGLEQQVDTGEHKHGWWTRLYNALLSPEARKEREEQEYVPRAEYTQRNGSRYSGK